MVFYQSNKATTMIVDQDYHLFQCWTKREAQTFREKAIGLNFQQDDQEASAHKDPWGNARKTAEGRC